MMRYPLLILIIVAGLAGSCSGRKNNAAHRGIIPDKDLIPILTEIHIGDGLLTLPEINYLFSGRDTLSSYIDIIEKRGYTKEEMDRTMRYYFIKKPKKLIKIYDKVLGTLSEMESRLEKEIPSYRNNEINFWRGKPSYYFPDGSGGDTAWFDFRLPYPGTYSLKFTLTIYPDDQTSDPRAGIFYSYPDSAAEGKRNYISRIPFLKDGLPHSYNFLMVVKKTVPVRLMGWFIDRENQAPFRQSHIRIDEIMLYRSSIL